MTAPKVTAILLVPAEGDPHRLLREGPCGARPPAAKWMPADPDPEMGEEDRWFPAHSGDLARFQDGRFMRRVALVLAWDGSAVVEGIDRLSRCVAAAGNRDIGYLQFARATMEDAILVARNAVEAMVVFGSPLELILLDAEGREIGG